MLQVTLLNFMITVVGLQECRTVVIAGCFVGFERSIQGALLHKTLPISWFKWKNTSSKNWRISCWTSWSKRNDPSSQKIRRGQWKHTRTHTPWKWILAWRDEVREWNDDLGCVLCFRPRGNLMKPFHTEDFYMWWCIAFCVIFIVFIVCCQLYALPIFIVGTNINRKRRVSRIRDCTPCPKCCLRLRSGDVSLWFCTGRVTHLLF